MSKYYKNLILLIFLINILLIIGLRCRPSDDKSYSQEKIDQIDRVVQKFYDSGLYPSICVGLVQDKKLVYGKALGTADKLTGREATTRSIYEIGSVGKVFTTTVLAILHDRKVLKIRDQVSRWLPAGVKVPKHPSGGPPITLEHLATHTSGLPGLPVNVTHFPTFQWRGYSADMLYEGLQLTELLQPPGENLAYSSLGTGLLGHLMSLATGREYEQLVENVLLKPLGMDDTVISLREGHEKRYAKGYETNESRDEAPYWDYGVLNGCGSHKSTVIDLARFLIAQWDNPSNSTNPISTTSRRELHRARWKSNDGKYSMSLGWFRTKLAGMGMMLGHRGRTAGHGAFIGFIPEQKIGVIVLANRGGRTENIKLAEFGEHLLRLYKPKNQL